MIVRIHLNCKNDHSSFLGFKIVSMKFNQCGFMHGVRVVKQLCHYKYYWRYKRNHIPNI
jgi:hypothetical protein